MTDHYSGHDPERGCGLLILAIGLAWLILGAGALVLAALGLRW